MLELVPVRTVVVVEVFLLARLEPGRFCGRRRAGCARLLELKRGRGMEAGSSMRLVMGEGKPSISFWGMMGVESRWTGEYVRKAGCTGAVEGVNAGCWFWDGYAGLPGT